ncbi:8207_t:CDS:2 [Funneliformis caledonium]|uniref:8207_t:CDS:1 n=1 Tax=Funneliformis caledonium TaxID=1117310 RepID=A0A9N9HKK2_9GLOM|nr:8207_t:CDS:2 [Funneliformis caledonium]
MFVFGSFKRLPTGGISNTLISGCVSRYNTKVNEIFFNRKRELVKFTNAFSATPELHVILGPPSTGKTALVREITSKGNFKPLFIDCRIGQFDTPTTVYNSISMQFKSFFDERKTFLKKTLPETEIRAKLPYFFNLKFKLFDEKKEEITSNTVSELLGKIANALPNWSFWKGYDVSPPILIIDEANLLSQLGDNSKEGQFFLNHFLTGLWRIRNKKSVFTLNVKAYNSLIRIYCLVLRSPHVTPYVVGDLSREEAEKYFEKHILPRYECKELEGKFDRIRRITGTRMLIIDRYVKEYKNCEGKLEDIRFSVYESEYHSLKRGLYPDKLRYLDKPTPPFWKGRDLIVTMDAIVKAEDQGYILEDDLIEMIGSDQVDSLVDYNFLHRRPTSRFANDIIDPPNKIILTATNQPSLRAMEQVLSEVTQRKK